MTRLRRLMRNDPDQARSIVWQLLEKTGGAMDEAAAFVGLRRQMFHRVVLELGLLERLVHERPALRLIAWERARLSALSPEQRAEEARSLREFTADESKHEDLIFQAAFRRRHASREARRLELRKARAQTKRPQKEAPVTAADVPHDLFDE
jgi:hypothetical protein